MALDGIDHRIGKQATQKRHNAVLVHIVHALRAGRLTQVVQQMAQVVQKRCADQPVVGAFLLGYLIDTYTGPAPGLNCLTTTLVFGVIYLLSRRLWMENPASNVAAVALGELVKIAIALLYFALLHRQEVPWWSVGRVLGLEALLALVCAPFVFGLLDAQLNAYRTGRRARATATK